MSVNKIFNIIELPNAYFNDNVEANKFRNQIIRNQVRISECQQNILETTFFSDENFDLINKQLILSIYNNSNKQFKIQEQKKESLLIVMRYIFIEYAKHLPTDYINQIRELNCKVVSTVVPLIMTEITQRVEYLDNIDKPRQLLPLPINERSNPSLSSTSNIFQTYSTVIPDNIPSIPGIPGIPGIPDIPGIPGIPGIPDIPDIPSVPKVSVPSVPKVSAPRMPRF